MAYSYVLGCVMLQNIDQTQNYIKIIHFYS